MPESLDNSIALSALNESPLGILIFKDNRIAWANVRLAQTLRVSEQALIGLDAAKAAGTVLAPLFDHNNPVCLNDPDGNQRWLNRQSSELKTGTVVQYFSDITEQAKLLDQCRLLEEKVRSLDTRDALTGLINRNSILQLLENQISRSRRYNNPLSLLRLSLEFAADSDDIPHAVRAIAQCLKDKLRWADQIGILDERTFLVILPETSFCDAKELAGKLANDRASFPSASHACRFRFGAASWQKGDDSRKLLQRLEHDQELSLIALLS